MQATHRLPASAASAGHPAWGRDLPGGASSSCRLPCGDAAHHPRVMPSRSRKILADVQRLEFDQALRRAVPNIGPTEPGRSGAASDSGTAPSDEWEIARSPANGTGHDSTRIGRRDLSGHHDQVVGLCPRAFLNQASSVLEKSGIYGEDVSSSSAPSRRLKARTPSSSSAYALANSSRLKHMLAAAPAASRR